MDFLKRMKSREFLEMALKTIAAVLVGLILIIFMEGMIYGIYMDKIDKNTASQYVTSDCVAYAEELDNGKYKVYIHNTKSDSWAVLVSEKTEEEIKTAGYKDYEFRTPNAFDVSISGVHYVVMALFIVAILGVYGWRFYKLNKEYDGFERKYKKTGKIFA